MPVFITYQLFQSLPIEQQLLAVWHEGTFLTCRQERTQIVGLYHLGQFFCEVYYDGQTNEIQHLQAFPNQGGLEVYLEDITLGDLPDIKP